MESSHSASVCCLYSLHHRDPARLTADTNAIGKLRHLQPPIASKTCVRLIHENRFLVLHCDLFNIYHA